MTSVGRREKSLETGRRVLEIEGAAVTLLAETLDENFAAAVDVMLAAEGRVIVCGMGKSGHIARKVAATLASTGSPAQFVHPADASHGDLGMVTTDDVVLLLSNSGETPELADVISYARRFSIPMIGVASNSDSTLLRQSDVALVLPAAPEACSIGMAPTTSTTMMLALGDALAVALMEHRAFAPKNYHDFHPGGRLGAVLTLVGDLMYHTDDLPLVQLDMPMGDTLLVITQKGFGVCGVVDDTGKMRGIITDGDLRRHMDGLLSHRASDVMTENPLTISADILASEALGRMNANKITTMFVVEPDDGLPIGLIHMHDCLRAGLG
mgnify:CR=1 FL=1